MVNKWEAGLLDDIRDLRRYLLLTEEHILEHTVTGAVTEEADDVNYSAEDDREED